MCTEFVICPCKGTSVSLRTSNTQACTVLHADIHGTFTLLSSVRPPKSGVHYPPKSVQLSQKVCTEVHSVHSVLSKTRRCTYQCSGSMYQYIPICTNMSNIYTNMYYGIYWYVLPQHWSISVGIGQYQTVQVFDCVGAYFILAS